MARPQATSPVATSIGTCEDPAENPRAFIFLMDYPNQHRIKVWGTAEFIEDDVSLLDQVTDPDYQARAQRVLVFHVKAWDVNCTQHIQQRYTVEEIKPIVQEIHGRVADLEARNRTLESQREALIPLR